MGDVQQTLVDGFVEHPIDLGRGSVGTNYDKSEGVQPRTIEAFDQAI